jgi:hypothetical protein
MLSSSPPLSTAATSADHTRGLVASQRASASQGFGISLGYEVAGDAVLDQLRDSAVVDSSAACT